jgi:hypothetical protein
MKVAGPPSLLMEPNPAIDCGATQTDTGAKHNAARTEHDRLAALVFPWLVPSNPQHLNFAADF